MKSSAKADVFDHQYLQILNRAKTYARVHDFYDGFPVSSIALEIRAFIRSCEALEIIDPDDYFDLVDLMFKPHPACIDSKDAEFIASVVANTDVRPSARVRTVRNVLTKRT